MSVPHILLLERSEELEAAAADVLRGLKETPGGDAYEYIGSMNTVEWLREAIEAYNKLRIMGT